MAVGLRQKMLPITYHTSPNPQRSPNCFFPPRSTEQEIKKELRQHWRVLMAMASLSMSAESIGLQLSRNPQRKKKEV
jgi:hypothetical protein